MIGIFGAPGLGDGGRGRPVRRSRHVVIVIDAPGLSRGPFGFNPPGVDLRRRRGRRIPRLNARSLQTLVLQVQRVPAKTEPTQQNEPQRHSYRSGRQPTKRRQRPQD
ncbi:hypothetical protein [uncultured Brevundimonas sp.]|uniref:hypothetical protein n=1 Tax=uncultured Brevundimonas sp. TaxID=213418 RepID=UPI0025F6ABA5|nr:hypothetical protein [uncultured Brevundimonas sp.]